MKLRALTQKLLLPVVTFSLLGVHIYIDVGQMSDSVESQTPNSYSIAATSRDSSPSVDEGTYRIN